MIKSLLNCLSDLLYHGPVIQAHDREFTVTQTADHGWASKTALDPRAGVGPEAPLWVATTLWLGVRGVGIP